MKKEFKTFIAIQAKELDSFYFSGGKIGLQVKVKVNDLLKVLPFEFGDFIVN